MITDFISPKERLKAIMEHPTYECRRCIMSHQIFEDARDCCYEKIKEEQDRLHNDWVASVAIKEDPPYHLD